MKRNGPSLPLAVVASIFFSASIARAVVLADHLLCYKIKDPAPKAAYTADLSAGTLVGCRIRVPARVACVGVDKTNVSPAPPGAPPGPPAAAAYFCYKVKCPKQPPSATAPSRDQFGVRSTTFLKPATLCAPIVPGSPGGAFIDGF